MLSVALFQIYSLLYKRKDQEALCLHYIDLGFVIITRRNYPELWERFDNNFWISANYTSIHLSSRRKQHMTFPFIYFVLSIHIFKNLANRKGWKDKLQVLLEPQFLTKSQSHLDWFLSTTSLGPRLWQGALYRQQYKFGHLKTYFSSHELQHLPNCPQKDGKSKSQSQIFLIAG